MLKRCRNLSMISILIISPVVCKTSAVKATPNYKPVRPNTTSLLTSIVKDPDNSFGKIVSKQIMEVRILKTFHAVTSTKNFITTPDVEVTKLSKDTGQVTKSIKRGFRSFSLFLGNNDVINFKDRTKQNTTKNIRLSYDGSKVKFTSTKLTSNGRVNKKLTLLLGDPERGIEPRLKVSKTVTDDNNKVSERTLTITNPLTDKVISIYKETSSNEGKTIVYENDNIKRTTTNYNNGSNFQEDVDKINNVTTSNYLNRDGEYKIVISNDNGTETTIFQNNDLKYNLIKTPNSTDEKIYDNGVLKKQTITHKLEDGTELKSVIDEESSSTSTIRQDNTVEAVITRATPSLLLRMTYDENGFVTNNFLLESNK